MTDMSNAMRQKARADSTKLAGVGPEEIRELRQQVDDLKGTATSTHLLLEELTTKADWEPPVLAKFRKSELSAAATAEKMAKTLLRLDRVVDRIEAASAAVLEQRIQHLRKLIVCGIIACNLPGTVGVLMLARGLGLI